MNYELVLMLPSARSRAALYMVAQNSICITIIKDRNTPLPYYIADFLMHSTLTYYENKKQY